VVVLPENVNVFVRASAQLGLNFYAVIAALRGKACGTTAMRTSPALKKVSRTF